MALVYRVTTNFCPLLSTFYCKCTVNITRFKSKKRSHESLMKTNACKISEDFIRNSFRERLRFRQAEAKRSILVQLDTPNSSAECKHYCQQYGLINNVFHYVSTLETQHYLLVEFQSNFSVENVTRAAVYMNDSEYVPMRTTVLWYRHKMHTKDKKNKYLGQQLTEIPKIKFTFPTHNLIKEKLMKFNSVLQTYQVTEQIHKLHDMLKLSDLDVRLRFYTAYQLELCFSGLFPTVSVVPFGSTVNGFGQVGCDLDLVCRLNNKTGHTENHAEKFVFQSKPYSSCERQEQKEFLSVLSQIMHKFIPGISNVNKILQARVPIIKFTNKYTNLQCDLSSAQLVALYMSELLYIYGEIDSRVKPLICTIRKWAKCQQITTDKSGQWITNFSLTLLIIFYFQLKGLLPSLNKLGQYAKNSSTVEMFDNQFIASAKQVRNTNNKNAESLHSLLYGFFEYYVQFDFANRAVCIREGNTKFKRDTAPMYIVNPFEQMLNVSKNVTLLEIMKIKDHMRNALVALDSDGPHTIITLLGLISSKEASKQVSTNYANVKDILIKNVSTPRKNTKEENGDSNPESGQSELIKEELLTDENSFDDSNKLKERIK